MKNAGALEIVMKRQQDNRYSLMYAGKAAFLALSLDMGQRAAYGLIGAKTIRVTIDVADDERGGNDDY